MTLTIVLLVAAYLLGSVSSAIIVCRIMSLPDPRGEGSGNPGATNVLRIGGKKAAALTLVGDFIKGLLPVLVAKHLGVGPEVLLWVALAAFFGHLYPIFFRFQGGKGVATGLGVLFGINLWLGLATAGTWLIVAQVFRLSSLAALIAMALAPIYTWLLIHNPYLSIGIAFMSAWLFWRHRSNIQNLLNKSEDRFDEPDENNG